MKNKLKSLDPFLAVGLVFSVALSIFLVLLGQDQITSLIVGLLSTIVTLLIDIIARIKESEDRLRGVILLGEKLAQDSDLLSRITQITNSFLAVKNQNFPLFIQRSQDILGECQDVLSGLERGYMVIEPGGKYAYGTKGVALAEKNVTAVAYEDIESWRTVHLQSALKANAEAIKRGVEIQRVFILNKESFDKAHDVLQAHKDAGVKVYVVPPDDLPTPQLLENYLIIDGKVLVVFYYTREGRRLREEKISVEPVEVDTAVSRFSAIMRRAKVYEQPK